MATRKELKEKKLREEAEFIESIQGKYITSSEKDKFRKTTVWNEFRKFFKAKTKVDPISLKKLPARSQLHHCDLNPKNYSILNKDNFILLNGTSHDLIHYLYGIYRNDKDVLKRVKKILDKMDELNNGKDICDYRKEEMQKNKEKSVITDKKKR